MGYGFMIFTPPNPEKEEMMGSEHVLYMGCECACSGMVSVFRGVFKGKQSVIQHGTQ